MDDLGHNGDNIDVQVFFVPCDDHTPIFFKNGLLKKIAESRRMGEKLVIIHPGLQKG